MVVKADRYLSEIREFASFNGACQRYIKSSLAIAEGEPLPKLLDRWARNARETSELKERARIYGHIPALRAGIPKLRGVEAISAYYQLLIPMSQHDLSVEKINSFGSYRFLYERLIGARIRAILPSAFLAAGMLPTIAPKQRVLLVQSISEAAVLATAWSEKEPVFIPKWVEKDDV